MIITLKNAFNYFDTWSDSTATFLSSSLQIYTYEEKSLEIIYNLQNNKIYQYFLHLFTFFCVSL